MVNGSGNHDRYPAIANDPRRKNRSNLLCDSDRREIIGADFGEGFSGYVQSGKHLFEMAMSKTSKPDELQRLIGGVTGQQGANAGAYPRKGKDARTRDVPVSVSPCPPPPYSL